MNECNFCGETIAMMNADRCGPKSVGDECLCCGRILVAENDLQPAIGVEPVEEVSSEQE